MATDMLTFATKQDKLIAGSGISINGRTISATGTTTPVEANVALSGGEDSLFSLKVGDTTYSNLNYHPFPDDFVVNSTLQAFGQSVINYSLFATGCMWYGGLQCTDLPGGMTQVECKVTAIRDTSDFVRNIAIIEIYSSNVAPFYWHYNTDSWDEGTGLDGWKYSVSIDGSKFDSSATTSDSYEVKARKANFAASSNGWEFYLDKVTEGNEIGTVIAFAGRDTAIPDGYLLCDGTDYSRTDYADLFAVIGTVYGSSSDTTFKVPNLAEKFIEGASTSVVTGTALDAHLPNITGSFFQDIDTETRVSGAFTYDTSGTKYKNYENSDNTTSGMMQFNASNSSSVYSDSCTTVQPAAVVMKYIIKYKKTTNSSTDSLKNLSGFDASKAQSLEHDADGNFIWVNK